jgi:hypothetical protein
VSAEGKSVKANLGVVVEAATGLAEKAGEVAGVVDLEAPTALVDQATPVGEEKPVNVKNSVQLSDELKKPVKASKALGAPKPVVKAALATVVVVDAGSLSEDKPATLEDEIKAWDADFVKELLVQQRLMRYNSTYTYDPVFALGFVMVYDQFIDGYPSETDQDAIFKAYVTALNEDPELYKKDAQKLEEWAAAPNGSGIADLGSKDGEVQDCVVDKRYSVGCGFVFASCVVELSCVVGVTSRCLVV